MSRRFQFSFRSTLCVVTLLSAGVISYGAKSVTAEDDAATVALLDEIVAGDVANTALIQHGTASYAITETIWRYSLPPGRELGDPPDGPGEERGPFDADLTVYFDFPRTRFEWRGNGVVQRDDAFVYQECTIRDGERTIELNLPQFPGVSITGRGIDPPIKAGQLRAANVIIYPKEHQRRRLIDPRQQQTAPSLAVRIRSLREDPKASLKAVKEADGLIRCEVANGSWLRAIYWIDPRKGYCIVKSKQWNPRFEKPVMIMVASARDAGSGAFVLETRTTKSSICFKDRMLPHSEEHIRLVGIDLSKRPDPKLFTIDGLGLAKGARIQDRFTGRDYNYQPPPSQ